MNAFEKSASIKISLRQGFQEGSSQMARRKCYGYTSGSDGQLVINSNEAQIVRWIFERYLVGDSLGKIASGMERQGIPSPTGKSIWNREAIDKLLSNEKYTGRVLLQKTISTGVAQIENHGLIDRYLSPILMRPLFLRACLKSSNEDGDESKSKHLGRNKEFALTIFPKSAELVEPAK